MTDPNHFALLLAAALIFSLSFVFAVSSLVSWYLGRHRTPPPPLARVIHRADPDARLKLAIGDLGSDCNPDPHWQERVLDAVGQPTAWHRYRIALWIGLAVAAAVVGLVWIA